MTESNGYGRVRVSHAAHDVSTRAELGVSQFKGGLLRYLQTKPGFNLSSVSAALMQFNTLFGPGRKDLGPDQRDG